MKRNRWFLAFTAVFAVLAGYVFWGTWSLGFAPVMPDDGLSQVMAGVGNWGRVLRKFMTSGKIIPLDVLWDGLLVSPAFCLELRYAVAGYLAALGLAYFLRGRGLSALAAYGAGLLLAFCGYWFSLYSAGHAGWFIWMSHGVFAFGLIDRAMGGDGRLRHWLLLGGAMAWGSFYQPDLWLLFSAFSGMYFAWCCFRERRLPQWKGVAAAAAAFVLIGAPSFWWAFTNDLKGRDRQIDEGQTVAERAAADEAEKRWIFVTNWSLPPEESLEFVCPRLNGDTSCPFTLSIGAQRGTGVRPYTGALGRPKGATRGNYRQHSLYVGRVTCLLALLALLALFGRRRRSGDPVATSDLAFFAGAAVLFWFCSLGRYCEPVYRVVYALPFGDYLRAPVKWHHLTEFCLCVLAGYGIEFLSRRLSWCVGRAAPWLVGALVLFGACDLARVNRLYCAPVDCREALRQDCNLRMTFLRRSDFNSPQVAAMVRAKRIVSLARPQPDLYMVGVLEPSAPAEPLPSPGFPFALGLASVLASAAVLSSLSRWGDRRLT